MRKLNTKKIVFSLVAVALVTKNKAIALKAERDLARIRPLFEQTDTNRHWNPYVTITLADKSQYKHKGLVDFADPLVDAKSGTFSVRAEMPNPERELLPGQFTNVRVLLDVRENAVAVPTKAITIEKSGPFKLAGKGGYGRRRYQVCDIGQ